MAICVGFFTVSTVVSDCRRAVSFGMRFYDNVRSLGSRSCCTTLKHGVCMIHATAEHTTPDGNAGKAWNLYLHATGAYISGCRQVVVTLWW